MSKSSGVKKLEDIHTDMVTGVYALNYLVRTSYESGDTDLTPAIEAVALVLKQVMNDLEDNISGISRHGS